MSIVSKAQAELELALMQAESDSLASSDLYLWLRECGLPPEAAIRFKDLVAVTCRIGDKIVSVGKLIVMQLREFIAAHKNLAIGSLMGAAITTLVAAIPFFGSILAPLGALFGLTVAVAGHRCDGTGSDVGVNIFELPQDLVAIARNFFDFFIQTLQVVISELVLKKAP